MWIWHVIPVGSSSHATGMSFHSGLSLQQDERSTWARHPLSFTRKRHCIDFGRAISQSYGAIYSYIRFMTCISCRLVRCTANRIRFFVIFGYYWQSSFCCWLMRISKKCDDAEELPAKQREVYHHGSMQVKSHQSKIFHSRYVSYWFVVNGVLMCVERAECTKMIGSHAHPGNRLAPTGDDNVLDDNIYCMSVASPKRSYFIFIYDLKMPFIRIRLCCRIYSIHLYWYQCMTKQWWRRICEGKGRTHAQTGTFFTASPNNSR